MDQALLVGPDINVGHEALMALDDAHLKVSVALLAILPEYGDWRLILSSPALDQNHLLKAHEQVAAVLRGDFVYRLPVIMILPTKDPFVRELRRVFGKVKDVTGLRLGGQSFGGRYLEEGYVFRIQ